LQEDLVSKSLHFSNGRCLVSKPKFLILLSLLVLRQIKHAKSGTNFLF